MAKIINTNFENGMSSGNYIMEAKDISMPNAEGTTVALNTLIPTYTSYTQSQWEDIEDKDAEFEKYDFIYITEDPTE